MLAKQEIVSDAAFNACPFSSDFNQVTAVTCKYYCPLVVNPTITNCCKELHHVAEFLHAPLKTLPRTKTSPISWENRSFFLLFRNVATFIESHCVFLLLFTVWSSIFDRSFRWLLPLSCFCGSSQCLLKVKITCKRATFVKK